MSYVKPKPQIGDIWEVVENSPLLLVDIKFDKEFNSHVAVFKHLTGKQHTFSVPIVSIRQGVGEWKKLA